MPSPTNLNLYRVGQLVTLKLPCLGEPAGTMAYVYEAYKIGREPGVSLITINGTDLGGWNFEEQRDHLQHLCDTSFMYDFSNVIKLAQDFERGTFKKAFSIGLIHLKAQWAQEQASIPKQEAPKVHQMQKVGGVWQVPGTMPGSATEQAMMKEVLGRHSNDMVDALEYAIYVAHGLKPPEHQAEDIRDLLHRTMYTYNAGHDEKGNYSYYEPYQADSRFGPDTKIYYDHSDRMWYVHDPTANDRYYELHGHWPPTDMRTRSFDPMG